jgi:hypothetical protein
MGGGGGSGQTSAPGGLTPPSNQGAQVATVAGKPVYSNQTIQGAGGEMTPGGKFINTKGMGAPVANIGGSNIYESQTNKPKDFSKLASAVGGIGGMFQQEQPAWYNQNYSTMPMRESIAETTRPGQGVLQSAQFDDAKIKQFLAWQRANGY